MKIDLYDLASDAEVKSVIQHEINKDIIAWIKNQAMKGDRIKLFVGCAPNGEDAESQAVLEYTARKHSSLPIDIVWMKHSNDPESFWYGWNSTMWSTPFSGFRWGIPEYCNFEGQAIYMDSDMIIQSDLAELWYEPWSINSELKARGDWRTCVMVIHCERMKSNFKHTISDLKQSRHFHGSCTQYFTASNLTHEYIQPMNKLWNCIDGEDLTDLSKAKILHYSSMNHQPHLKYALPRLEKVGMKHWFDGDIKNHWRQDLIDLFDRNLQEAEASRYKVSNYIPAPENMVNYTKLSQKGFHKAHEFVR